MNKITSSPLIYSDIVFTPATAAAADVEIIEKFQDLHRNKVVYFPGAPNPRTDVSPNPWKFVLLDEHRIPAVPGDFKLTFAEVTDLRAHELARLCESTGLTVCCYWSGGIDSTLILAAIVKNFPKHLLSRVYVCMNNASYIENPIFFERVIKKYNLPHGPLRLGWTKTLMVPGHPADALWAQADLIEFNRYSPGTWKNNPMTNPDALISWISKKISRSQAHWFYEIVTDSSRVAGIELMTYEDFYWWSNFNFYYTAQCLFGYHYLREKITPEDFQKYRSNLIPWYHTNEYQIWSMVNRSNNVKFDGTIRNYKNPAKYYIFDLDKNVYYRDYKTKLGSDLSKIGADVFLIALYANGTTHYRQNEWWV